MPFNHNQKSLLVYVAIIIAFKNFAKARPELKFIKFVSANNLLWVIANETAAIQRKRLGQSSIIVDLYYGNIK